MKCLERALRLALLAVALVTPACSPVSVPPWPYTIATDDGSPSDDGATDGGTSAEGAAGASGIAANYTPSPLRCDGGLCNTDNYALCSVADRPPPARIGFPVAVLVTAGALAMAGARRRKADRRNARRSS